MPDVLDGPQTEALVSEPKRMTAEEFLRGHPIQDGYRFGPERV